MFSKISVKDQKWLNTLLWTCWLLDIDRLNLALTSADMKSRGLWLKKRASCCRSGPGECSSTRWQTSEGGWSSSVTPGLVTGLPFSKRRHCARWWKSGGRFGLSRKKQCEVVHITARRTEVYLSLWDLYMSRVSTSRTWGENKCAQGFVVIRFGDSCLISWTWCCEEAPASVALPVLSFTNLKAV